MKYLLYLIIACTLLSCRQGTIKHKPVSIIISYPCAVIIVPGDKKIDELKKNNSADDYNAIVDDNVNYEYESTTFLDSVKVKQINKRSEGWVVFKTSTGQISKMDLSRYNWAILLFNGKDKPVLADMTDIDAAYKTYMK